MTHEELNEIEERAKAAMTGAWGFYYQSEYNDSFIAHAHTDITRLIAALREARKDTPRPDCTEIPTNPPRLANANQLYVLTFSALLTGHGPVVSQRIITDILGDHLPPHLFTENQLDTLIPALTAEGFRMHRDYTVALANWG